MAGRTWSPSRPRSLEYQAGHLAICNLDTNAITKIGIAVSLHPEAQQVRHTWPDAIRMDSRIAIFGNADKTMNLLEHTSSASVAGLHTSLERASSMPSARHTSNRELRVTYTTLGST